MAYDIGIRKELNKSGISNDKIGWDKKTGYVTVGGQNFLKPQQMNDGRSYTDRQSYDKAFGSLQNILPKQPTQQASQGNGAPQQYNDYRNKQMELMNKYEQMMDKPFEYNPESDPRYQAYKQLAQKQAGVASQNAMESLNSRGILNSTVTSDRLGQIQQSAEQNALAAVPQFYEQAAQQRNDSLRNTAQLLGMVTDEARDTRNYDRGVLESDRNYDRGILESDRSYGLQERGQKLNETQVMAQLTGFMPDGTRTNTKQQQDLQNQWMVAEQMGTITPELAQLYGMQEGTPTWRAKQDLVQNRISQQNANTSSYNAQTSRQNANQSASDSETRRLMQIWEATGVAPEGIPGVQPGTPIAQQEKPEAPPKPGDYKMNDEFATDYSYVVNNPEEAKNLLKANAESFIQTYGFDGYRALLAGLPNADENELLKYLEE
jgi:hypothetical protein